MREKPKDKGRLLHIKQAIYNQIDIYLEEF